MKWRCALSYSVPLFVRLPSLLPRMLRYQSMTAYIFYRKYNRFSGTGFRNCGSHEKKSLTNERNDTNASTDRHLCRSGAAPCWITPSRSTVAFEWTTMDLLRPVTSESQCWQSAQTSSAKKLLSAIVMRRISRCHIASRMSITGYFERDHFHLAQRIAIARCLQGMRCAQQALPPLGR